MANGEIIENLVDCEIALRQNSNFSGKCLQSPSEDDYQKHFKNTLRHEDRSVITGGKCLPGYKLVNKKCKKIVSMKK